MIDTHALLWLVEGDRRLSTTARSALADTESRLFLSAVTAWEFADLQHRGRLPTQANLNEILARLGMTVLPVPDNVWTRAYLLPQLHRDPVDRMLVAHALESAMTLVTADRTIRRYPVRTLW